MQHEEDLDHGVQHHGEPDGLYSWDASGLKHLGMMKKELKEKVALVVGGFPDQVTGMRLCMMESLRDEALRVKSLESHKMKEQYDKKVKALRWAHFHCEQPLCYFMLIS